MNASGEASHPLDPPTIATADPKDKPVLRPMRHEEVQITESYENSQKQGTEPTEKEWNVCTINFVAHRLSPLSTQY